MPFAISSLSSERAHRFQPRSRPCGHTHVPPDRLQISPSDPVLVAAQVRLSSIPDPNKLSIIEESSAGNPSNHRSVKFHLQGRITSQTLGDRDDGSLPAKAVDTSTSSHRTTASHFLKTDLCAAPVQRPSLRVLSDDSWDIAEVMTIMSTIDVSRDNADISISENSRHGPDLLPLASETFKEEMYIRGYLKRPANRSANGTPRKSSTSLMFMSGKIFPKVLRRRQGCKVAESLRAEQDPEAPGTHLSEKRLSTIASVTLCAPHADDPSLESLGTDTATSASGSFDLHEFSYITAFTTPPSSPSTVLDVETFKNEAGQADSNHAE